MQKLLFPIVLAIVAVVGVVSYQLMNDDSPPELETSLLYSSPRTIEPFVLQGTEGNEVTNSDLEGQWTILFTGYTFCPDICPTTMAQLKQRWSQLTATTNTPVRVWMVSVDPQRDDIPRLRNYVEFFGEDFFGVTAEHKELFPFVRNLGLMYSIPDEDETNYLVNHSAALILINPDGHQQAVFRASHEPGMIPTVNPQLLINDFNRIVSYLE
ncbi:SCO family protein [Aliidiomarina minuta]|uniref:SCO family protein n=2 Tax=Aliidiomarina minuta TaxID=880057 RepID=A0A432WAK8_9GAMM|nr:SCO family protein [Aliidiomarina minuta]